MKRSIPNALLHILHTNFLIHIENLSYHLNLTKDLGMNQLEQMEMLYYVENEFNINIDDREVAKINTVRDLVNAVRKYAY
ncbi:MAG: acyl carrier protein [Cytophagales bacterium]